MPESSLAFLINMPKPPKTIGHWPKKLAVGAIYCQEIRGGSASLEAKILTESQPQR